MEVKTARLTLLIDPRKKAAFERLCASQDRTASQVVRQMIRDYLAGHGVRYADEADADSVAAAPPAAPASRPAARSAASRVGRPGRRRPD